MRNYLWFFAMPVILIVMPAAVLSVVFGPISGDMVRIGRWSERDFGWNAPQPIVRINGNGVSKPDVVVLGDSFSQKNIWQSVLSAKRNETTLSFHYLDVNCPTNWIRYALNDVPSATTVIIEVVERSFMDVFLDGMHSCRKKNPIPLAILPETTSPDRSDWPPTFSVGYALRTAINTARMDLKGDSSVRGDQVINAPIRNNCADFSNRRKDRLLYFIHDEDTIKWTEKNLNRAIANVAEIQKTFAGHGKKFVLIVVPDKLSVYQDCLVNDNEREERERVNVTKMLIAAGINTPDLLTPFKENIQKIADLYLPDDSHVSNSGYKLLANELDKFISRRFPVDQPAKVK